MSAGAWEHATRERQGGRWSGVARTFLYLNLAYLVEPQFFDCTRLKVEVSAPSQVQGSTSKAKAQEPRLFNGEGDNAIADREQPQITLHSQAGSAAGPLLTWWLF